MRTAVLAALGLALLAACAGDPPRRSSPVAAGPPAVGWQTRLVGNEVVVVLTDPAGYYRVERVALVGPGGRVAEAREITRRVDREGGSGGAYGGAPGVGVSGGYGSGHGGHGGVGITIPLGGPPSSAPAPRVVRTVARVRLPDPVAYRLAPERWTVRVTLTDGAGDSRTADMPAPRPSD